MTVGGIAMVLVALLATACAEESPATIERSAVSSSRVSWIEARTPMSSVLLEAPARVVDARDGRAAISAPLRTRIVRVLVEPGAVVAVDAPIVEVVLPEAAAAAAAYLAAVEELAAYERRAAELANLRAEGLVRTSEVSAVLLEVARLRGARDVASTTLRAAGLSVGDARGLAASGGRTTLRAPIAGTVMSVSAVVGASHMPEDVLVELSAGGARRVEARLTRPLPEGARVELVVVGSDAIEARLVGTAGSREADGSTRAWFELATSVPAGTTGRIRVAGELRGAAIPASAIGHGPDGDVVWRSEGGIPRRVSVRVVAISGADAIVEGIATGDEIASDANQVNP